MGVGEGNWVKVDIAGEVDVAVGIVIEGLFFIQLSRAKTVIARINVFIVAVVWVIIPNSLL